MLAEPLQQCTGTPRLKRWNDLQAPEGSTPTFKYTRSGFLRAMSDAGLKPTVVYHNLTPAELYEKVCHSPCMGTCLSSGQSPHD